MTKTCVICGKEFETSKSSKLICSPECRKEYVKIRDRGRKSRKKEHERMCVVCGKVFVTVKGAQMMCSRECANKRKLYMNALCAKRRKGFDEETIAFLERWKRVPQDPHKLDKALAECEAKGQTYAERQKAESIKRWARIEI